MPDQPAIEQRIADVLMAHSDESTLDPETNFSKAVCGCGWKPPYRNTSLEDAELVHARHVAAVLVSELGLTADWALTSGGRQTVMSERAAKDKAQRWPESFGVASRYVTAWEDQ